MRAGDAEIDDVEHRLFPIRCRENFQRIACHGAIMFGAFHRVIESTMFAHGGERCFQIAVLNVALFQRATPEIALFFRAATERQHHRQSDFAFAEIVTGIYAEF